MTHQTKFLFDFVNNSMAHNAERDTNNDTFGC